MGVIALFLSRAPSFALRGATVTLLVLVMAGLINFRIKLSLHALFAFYSALILFVINPVAGAITFTLALLVFWSRLYLSRHDFLETFVGSFLGLLAGLVTVW
jgi:membrane-associated phospholipid phosphatase